ncbi:hypothetical protein ABG067_005345 [Albugo candida]
MSADHRTTSAVKSTAIQYLNNPNACYPFTVGETEDSDEFDDIKSVVLALCSDWKNALKDEIQVKIVSGGITNQLYRLIWMDKSLLVRIYGENTEILIDRQTENEIFAKLSREGFAPTYYGRFKNGRIEGWLNADPLEPEDMQQIEPVPLVKYVAKEVGKMHSMQLDIDRTPVLWKKLNQFVQLAMEVHFSEPEKQNALNQLNLALWSRKVSWVQSFLSPDIACTMSTSSQVGKIDSITKEANKFAMDVVFCHNDLLSGNILYNNAWKRVQIIDYEYGAYNFRAFDIANHFCEYCGFDLDLSQYPMLDQQSRFFDAYLVTAAPELYERLHLHNHEKSFHKAFYEMINKFAMASHVFWAFWAIVQARYSKIDFDFLNYAQKRFQAFDQQRKLLSFDGLTHSGSNHSIQS